MAWASSLFAQSLVPDTSVDRESWSGAPVFISFFLNVTDASFLALCSRGRAWKGRATVPGALGPRHLISGGYRLLGVRAKSLQSCSTSCITVDCSQHVPLSMGISGDRDVQRGEGPAVGHGQLRPELSARHRGAPCNDGRQGVSR